ncbi:MAG: ABC-F family ATP-binding cassette domain-containing protein [Proteobacteria bacterium]|nr:ABC-F family ATP-binding cassette domain-containing protein [Pseudomonadota bacterium]
MTLPVLTIHNGCLAYGLAPLFQDLDINILENDHICLIGSNGTGKSTLLKVLAGQVELDQGTFYKKPHLKIHYLPQDLDLPFQKTALEAVMEGKCPAHEAEILLDALEMKTTTTLENLSGGEKRRILLARTLVGDPDVLLLDEPTNHLDIKAIQWLETYLNHFKKAVVIISHDRRFLEETSRSIVWLDRGQTRRTHKGYAYFDQWMEEIEQADARALEKIQSKLRLEEHWKQRGVTARRKRNQGRLEKLTQMRAQRKLLISNQPKSIEIIGSTATFGNQLVSELTEVTKNYEGRLTLGPLSTRIFKGDRIGIIGPNGCGKTTLLNLILGRLKPDMGKARIGKSIIPAFFEQERNSMDPQETPWQYLCPQGGDTINVQGTDMHVMGYLKKFLFDDKQARGRIGILSGGEKNRLQLAKVLAQPSNVLVLDEPTNDLDMDTLDLLIDMLTSYKGTLILISHDRDFIDQLVTVVFAIQPNGTIIENIGGYTDYENISLNPQEKRIEKKEKKEERREVSKPKNPALKKLSYSAQRDLEIIPKQLEDVERRIKEIENALLDPDLYTKNPIGFDTLIKELQDLKEKKDSLENIWLTLSLD